MAWTVYISYRKLDNHNYVNKMADFIEKHLDDVEITVGLMELFPDEVQTEVQNTAALLVFITPDWEGPWLEDEYDSDRIALETALAHERTIIPLLVDGGSMPAAADLPADLAGFAAQKAASLTPDSIKKLAQRIVRHLHKTMQDEKIAPVQPSPAPPKPAATESMGTATIPLADDELEAMLNEVEDESASVPIGSLMNQPKAPAASPAFNITSEPIEAPRDARGFFSIPVEAAMYPVRNDQRWPTKMFLGGIAMIIPLLGPITLTGYNIRAARRVLDGNPNLPEWDDIPGDIGRGCFMSIGAGVHLFLYGIVFMIISAALGFLIRIFPPLGFIMLFVFPLFGYVVVTGLLNAIARYIASESIGEFFNFAAIISEMRNFSRNIIFLIYFWFYSIIVSLFFALAGPTSFILCGLPMLLAVPYFTIGYYVLMARWAQSLSDYKYLRKEVATGRDLDL